MVIKTLEVVSMCILVVGLCRSETVNFDKATVGSAPPGWTVAMTHSGGPPKWEVLADNTAPSKPNVLAQVSTDRTAGRFPLVVYDRARIVNGKLCVRFKTVSGSVDQAAGLVWRYRDPDNYYIARANALENNVVLYKVENGQRLALAPKGTPSRTYGIRHDVPKGVWNILAVDFERDVFKVSFNGEMLFEVIDSTFIQSGKVGLWTKADSVTHFDDFQVASGKENDSR